MFRINGLVSDLNDFRLDGFGCNIFSLDALVIHDRVFSGFGFSSFDFGVFGLGIGLNRLVPNRFRLKNYNRYRLPCGLRHFHGSVRCQTVFAVSV